MARAPRVAAGTAVVANVDDPLVAWAAGAPRAASRGSAPASAGGSTPPRAPRAAAASCGTTPTAAGDWACSACDLCAGPQPDLWLEATTWCWPTAGASPSTSSSRAGPTWPTRPWPWPARWPLGLDAGRGRRGHGHVANVAGRYQVVAVDGRAVRLLLAKNPAGWAEALDLLRPAPLPVVVGINARIADGRDPSWLWDVPFERLRGRFVVATGERGRDLAVRLRYAERRATPSCPDDLDAVHAATGGRQRLARSHAGGRSTSPPTTRRSRTSGRRWQPGRERA